LDEPFGDLDPVTLRDVTNSLKKISKTYGITIVMISHNTDFIKELSNRAIFMDDGKIIDDSENINEIVDNFIDFCHADYLKGGCWMFDVIMVPVDGSEYSFKAADVAIEIAQKFSSKIAAVHVLEEFSFNSYDSEEDSGDAILAKITKKAGEVGVEVTEHLLTADPLRDMSFIVAQTRADLVVIHAHGANNNRFVSFEENDVSDTQIGSVSERLLRNSNVPVLLVK